MGAALDHAPAEDDRVWPVVIVPEIIGGELFDGFDAGAVVACATSVAAELAGALVPPALLADSCTTIVCPTSAAVSKYDCPVAPLIALQSAPELSQSCHW